MKKYEVGEHAADLELTVWGRSPKELFRNAARAMLDYADPKLSKDLKISKEIRLQAGNLEDLFIYWLNEILFWLEVEGFGFTRFSIRGLTDTALSAVLSGRRIDATSVESGPEIKAATYHDLSIRQTPAGWEAHVIFDL